MNNTNRWKIFEYDIVDSTNEVAKRLCEDYCKQFVVTANSQTNGKGQYGRKWLSPYRKNLLATFCAPKSEIKTSSLVSFAVANAVCITLNEYGFAAKCKWPNDIELDENKISGILTEKINERFLIGIGLNINWPEKRSELENSKRYTSLLAESGKEFNVMDFVSHLGENLNIQLKKSDTNILKSYKSFWNKKAKTEILVDDKWIPAKQAGIDSDGALIVEMSSNNIIKIKTSARVRINGIQNSKS